MELVLHSGTWSVGEMEEASLASLWTLLRKLKRRLKWRFKAGRSLRNFVYVTFEKQVRVSTKIKGKL